ncbi:MAG: hypothetical protein COA59_10645 [Colwellia sp.]|nr:MAG: hypothetical protein COA59_10645 [Colwellia sp.]
MNKKRQYKTYTKTFKEEAISGSMIFTRTRCQIYQASSKALCQLLTKRVDFHLRLLHFFCLNSFETVSKSAVTGNSF